jgi:hypothetical protein
MGNAFADPRTAQHIYPPVKSAEIIPTATCSHDPIEPQEGGQTSKIHDVNAAFVHAQAICRNDCR